MKFNDKILPAGTKVFKYRGKSSPKPFKSGLQVNTVKGVTINPNTGRDAYTFEEDESVVDCQKCRPFAELA